MSRQRLFHQLLGVLFALLLLTGAVLHVEALRGSTAEFRSLLQKLHALSGVIFILVFAGNYPYYWSFRQGSQDGLNRSGYLMLLVLAGLGIATTGGGMLLSVLSVWSAPSDNSLYQAHLWSAALGAAVILPHLAHALLTRRRKTLPASAEAGGGQSTNRRGFLGYLMGGLLFGGIAFVWRWAGQKAATIKSETVEAFAQCNKMFPAPKPLPDSSPPKGGGYTGKFRVYKINPQMPCATNADWKFTVSGLVDRPRSYMWEDFLKLPRVVQVSDFHCVEGWSVFSITYEGVRLSDFLDLVGVKPQARYVKFYSAEEVYTDALSLEDARLSDVMAAVLLDGREIPSDLGGPVRLVIPQMYAYKAVKWLVGMELTDAPHKGYWEERGYPVNAWVSPKK